MNKKIKNHKINLLFDSKKFIFNKKEPYKIEIKTKDLKQRIQFLLKILNSVKTEVTIRFCDNRTMEEMNGKFRNKFSTTDVLSFPSDQFHTETTFYLGDLLVCVPKCYEQSIYFKITFSEELEKMIIHGLVHLKGFDHERSASDYHVMLALEKSLSTELNSCLGFPKWCSLSL